MVVFMISWPILDIGHVGSKPRPLDQIEENLVDALRDHFIAAAALKFVRMFVSMISRTIE